MGSQRAESSAPSRVRQADPESAPRTEIPTVTAEIPVARKPVAGKRKALKDVGPSRGSLGFMPSLRAAVGVTVLAVAAGGVMTSPEITHASAEVRAAAPNALVGSNTAGNLSVERGEVISRDNDRTEANAAENDLVEKAQRQAAKRDAKLGQLARAAEKEAGEIVANAWVLPISSYRLSARFGQAGGYWSSGYHTGLDFAAPSGTPIHAIAGGTVTSTGYDGAYGNKTVITLEDGTEIWYCHQTSYDVSTGQTVRAGDVIGSVGSTGNSTGPHLHLEVRPGGGDPVDPAAALVVNGVTP